MNTMLHIPSPYIPPLLKTMPLREQPAYRVTQDATACNQTELLAALIGGQKQIEIAQALLAHFGHDIRRIYQAHPQELAKVRGINQATAVRIKAALTLGLRLSLPAEERIAINSPGDAAALVQSEMALLEKEHLRVLLLVPEGRRGDVAKFLEAGADATLAEPFFPAELRLLVRALLRSDAADPLTGLPNRGAYELGLSREMSRAQREGRTLGLGLLDVDRFKRVNTNLGYRAADFVLREVARRLREAFRVTDVVARWGGEEFAVLLAGLPKDVEEARARGTDALERARELVRATPVPAMPGTEVSITVSGGLALYPQEADERGALFDKANERLARAKRTRNRVVTADEPDDDDTGATPSRRAR